MILFKKVADAIQRPHVRWFSSRMALGTHKFQRLEPGSFQFIVGEAINNGVTVIDTERGESARAVADALLGYDGATRLTVLHRLGYSVIEQPDGGHAHGNVVVETIPVQDVDQVTEVIHSLNTALVQNFFRESPLLDLAEENLDVIPMIQNPEEHRKDALPRLTEVFCSLEEAVTDGKIPSFGVVSNGLSLPSDHPLYLDWRSVVFKAARNAAEQTSKASSSLSVIQLPVNILETRGRHVAREINSYISDRHDPFLPTQLDIYAMRPLTCFPDEGTGSGRSFQLIDHRLPTEPGVTEWTHDMMNPPPVYPATYRKALSYFDAVDLLEAQQQRELTEEEEETLHGAKILHGMIQDLDAGLEDSCSFAQHEQELMARVLPIINDTFDEVDEQSVEVLQNFFASIGIAARYHIARNTRELIKRGGEGMEAYNIPPDMTMQEFALREILQEKSFSKIVVGASKPEHVRDIVDIFKRNES